MFNLVSKFNPSGDQPKSIENLVNGIKDGKKNQVLLPSQTYTCKFRLTHFI